MSKSCEPQATAIPRVQAGSGNASLQSFDQTLADDAEFILPTRANGGLAIVAASPEGGLVHLAPDGTVTLLSGSANFVAADTDAKLCVYKSGSTSRVKNRLGASARVTVMYLGS